MITTRPHDLLRLCDAAAVPTDAPAWVVHALHSAPWVVVRRGPAPAGSIAVGVRGSARSERFGTDVAVEAVRQVVAPEELTHLGSAVRDLPAMRTLGVVRPLLDDTGLTWGPTGSVGFELATGHCTATPESDLDLLVRTGDVTDALPALTWLNHAFHALAARVDCQVETRSGAVALAELVTERPDVLIRTVEGPRLVARAALS